MAKKTEDENIVWYGRKRWLFFGIPWTFTRYTLKKDKFLVKKGLLSLKEDEVRLYRIMDVSMRRGLMQRIFGLGTITCVTADKTLPTLVIKNIKQSEEVKEMLSDMVEEERERKRVSSREFIGGHYDSDIDDDDFDNH